MPKSPAGRIVSCREAFTAEGHRIVRRGETFHADHPVVRANPGMFEEFRVDNVWETATAEPRVA
jgi:hypothetical protein